MLCYIGIRPRIPSRRQNPHAKKIRDLPVTMGNCVFLRLANCEAYVRVGLYNLQYVIQFA